GGHLAKDPEAGPREGPDGHHEHQAHEGGHGDLLDERARKEDEEQQAHSRHDARQAVAAARTDVDDALADHGAPAHAAEESGRDIGGPLGDALLVAAPAGFRHFIHHGQRQQAFDQPHGGHDQRVGKDDHQGVPVERNHRDMELRQSARDGRDVSHGSGRNVSEDHHGRYGDDRDEGGGYGLGQFRQEVDDEHGDGHETDHDPKGRAGHPGDHAGSMGFE